MRVLSLTLVAALGVAGGACGKEYRYEGDECVATSECAAGLVCDLGAVPHVCAGTGTRPPDAGPPPPDADPTAPDADPTAPDANPTVPDAAPPDAAPDAGPDAAPDAMIDAAARGIDVM
jgi:hypothetical protein